MKHIHIIGSPDATTNEAELMMQFARDAVNDTQIEVSFCRVDQVAYIIDNIQSQMIDTTTGRDLAENDLVWFRGKLAAVISEVSTIANYLDSKHVKHTNSFYSRRRGVGKISQMYILATNNLPIPKTVSAANSELAKYVRGSLEYPMIVKDTHGSHGDQNYLVHTEQELLDVVLNNPDVRFMAQEFIAGDGDYRVLFAGDNYRIIKRLGGEDTHLNNTSQGAQASLIPQDQFPANIVQEARKFADICEYEIAGVDVIINRDSGKHYFLEINSQPQVATGAFLEEKQKLVGDYFQSLIADQAS